MTSDSVRDLGFLVLLLIMPACGDLPADSSRAVESPPALALDTSAVDDPPAAPVVEARSVAFDELSLGMRLDQRFRPEMMTPEVEGLIGQRIRIVGYMIADARLTDIAEFVMTPTGNLKVPADQVVKVIMNEGLTVDYYNRAAAVTGELRFEPFQGIDGNTWMLYEIDAESVTPQIR